MPISHNIDPTNTESNPAQEKWKELIYTGEKHLHTTRDVLARARSLDRWVGGKCFNPWWKIWKAHNDFIFREIKSTHKILSLILINDISNNNISNNGTPLARLA